MKYLAGYHHKKEIIQMTKKELIEELKYAQDDEEIIISVEDQVRYGIGSVPLLLPIDYVGGNFINITIC
jgi:hypothetical protein